MPTSKEISGALINILADLFDQAVAIGDDELATLLHRQATELMERHLRAVAIAAEAASS